VASGDLIQELRVVLDLSLEPIEGATLPMPTIVHVDLDVGELTITAELVETTLPANEAVIQPILQLADSLSEAVLDWNMVGFHAQYYV
jgi:hypothetical protein